MACRSGKPWSTRDAARVPGCGGDHRCADKVRAGDARGSRKRGWVLPLRLVGAVQEEVVASSGSRRKAVDGDTCGERRRHTVKVRI
jgi:hypothetical protein